MVSHQRTWFSETKCIKFLHFQKYMDEKNDCHLLKQTLVQLCWRYLLKLCFSFSFIKVVFIEPCLRQSHHRTILRFGSKILKIE